MSKDPNKVKWYIKLVSMLDHEKTSADTVVRVLAYIADWIISGLFFAAPCVLTYMYIVKEPIVNQDLSVFPGYLGYVVGVLCILFYVIYFVYYPLKRCIGQTPGMRFFSLKVVRKDGSDVDFKTLMMRNVWVHLVLEGSLAAAGSYLYQLIAMLFRVTFHLEIYFIILLISSAICIISLSLALRSKSKRTLHDYLSDTWVISTAE